MESQRNNKGVIILLIIVIVILSVLCILFATGTISLKSNNVNNNETNENIDYNNQNIRYYQFYKTYGTDSENSNYKSSEIELKNDGSARWRFGGDGSGGEYYKGTYIENANRIILTIERDMPTNTICDENNTVFPCNTTLILNKNNDNTISSIDELGVEGLSYVYKQVDKSQLKFIN